MPLDGIVFRFDELAAAKFKLLTSDPVITQVI
jgi:hypothetical protein